MFDARDSFPASTSEITPVIDLVTESTNRELPPIQEDEEIPEVIPLVPMSNLVPHSAVNVGSVGIPLQVSTRPVSIKEASFAKQVIAETQDNSRLGKLLGGHFPL